MKNSTRRVSTTRRAMCMLSTILLVPTLACAHVGIGQPDGFAHGFGHPFMGLDHVAAMVAVGLWAAQRGGRAVWAIPLSFVFSMAVGCLLVRVGVAIPFIEPGIIASVVVLGLLVAAAVSLPLLASSLLVTLFAVFHGHAHGMEMPETMRGLEYGGGFVAATGFLHACGIGLGLLAQRMVSTHALRYAGGGILAIGLYLCLA